MSRDLATAVGLLARRHRVALVAGVGWLVVLVLFVALIWPRAKSFLVEARTERLEVRGLHLNPDSSWDVTGFCLVQEAPLLSDAPDSACAPLAEGTLLRPADGTTADIVRLGAGELTIRIAEGHDAPTEGTGGASAEAPLATVSEPGGGELAVAAGSLRLVHPPRGIAGAPVQLDFSGRATLGVVPENRAQGILLEGRVGGSVAGWLGAGRFDVIESGLARGDVVTMVAHRRLWGGPPDDCSGLSRGFVRLPPGDEEGVLVAYVSCADALRIDRVGAWFELTPSWAARLLHDPLPLALAGLAGLLASLAAIAALFRREEGRERE